MHEFFISCKSLLVETCSQSIDPFTDGPILGGDGGKFIVDRATRLIIEVFKVFFAT